MTRGGAHSETRRMMETAIRRLNVLEYVILGVAMALALLAGALAAWMVEGVAGAPFRLTWALSSLFFFVVPGWVVFRRERRADQDTAGKADRDTAGKADRDTAGKADRDTAGKADRDTDEKADDGGR